jgi:hypothetical protein
VKVIAVDPGIMTGYCYAKIEDGKLTYHPFQITDDVDDFWRRLGSFEPHYIVIEDFEFRRGKRSAGGLELFPVQMVGVARLYSAIAPHQCAAFVQKAAQGKSYYTNAVLQQNKLYVRGIPHAMDASRHLLHWYTFGHGNKYAGSKTTVDSVSIVDRHILE